jgi:DNA-binding NtrC family response regulator
MSEPIAILAIADISLRERVGKTLKNLHWQVLEAAGGAEALAQLEAGVSTAVILDTWFPDLEIDEFVKEVGLHFPDVDMISTDGSFVKAAKSRPGRRGELLYALRVSQEWDGAAGNPTRPSPAAQRTLDRIGDVTRAPAGSGCNAALRKAAGGDMERDRDLLADAAAPARLLGGSYVHTLPDTALEAVSDTAGARLQAHPSSEGLPEFHGTHPLLLEVCRRIRLVAPRKTPVLVQGPSGSGKELVAQALHRLSPRAARPLVVLNCAAIPESLLEAELFGHTRGAFTGAVQGRCGRIEAANGGTLFLDEIGEMPLSLQAKLLRFLEAGELQRVGDNDLVRVDVRVVAASHQPLALRAKQGLFRIDLYFRLAVFLIETPALIAHMEDIDGLSLLFLRRLTEHSPAKLLTPAAIERLHQHTWPGNVRELAHVMGRAYILAGDRREIDREEIEFASFA